LNGQDRLPQTIAWFQIRIEGLKSNSSQVYLANNLIIKT